MDRNEILVKKMNDWTSLFEKNLTESLEASDELRFNMFMFEAIEFDSLDKVNKDSGANMPEEALNAFKKHYEGFLNEINSIWLTEVAKKRIEFLGFTPTNAALGILLSAASRPGIAVMYISYIIHKIHKLATEFPMMINPKTGKFLLTSDMVIAALNGKYIKKENLEKIWDAQKLPLDYRKEYYGDNVIGHDNMLDEFNGDGIFFAAANV